MSPWRDEGDDTAAEEDDDKDDDDASDGQSAALRAFSFSWAGHEGSYVLLVMLLVARTGDRHCAARPP